jgi:CspA family cold shock protein
MANGKVKWFNPTKGFGFIAPEEGGADVFVHISALERAGIPNLNEGQRVSYDLAPNNKGKTSAVNLRLLNEAA